MKPETSDPYLAMLVNLCEFGPESEGWKNIGEITNTNRKTRHMKFKSSQTNIYKYARKLVTDGLAEEMKKMAAEQVQSALVFFWAFVNVLLQTLESYLIQLQKETKMQSQPNLLPKNGVGSE